MNNFDLVDERVREVLEKDEMRAFQSPVRGEEIMKICKIEAGPLVGILKTAIEEAILDDLIPNEYDAALDFLMKNKEEIMSGVEAVENK